MQFKSMPNPDTDLIVDQDPKLTSSRIRFSKKQFRIHNIAYSTAYIDKIVRRIATILT